MEVHYIPSLVFLSIVVAIMASYVAFSLAHNITNSRGPIQTVWLLGGSVAMGFGIWTMHFIGMLATEITGMAVAYDLPLMILSAAVAIAGSGMALYVVSRKNVRRSSLVVGGLAMAAAMSGMHYIGMFSMRMPAQIEWSPTLVLLSVLIAELVAFAALTTSLVLRNRQDRTFILILSSVIMGLAITGMHYVGMAAATFVQDSSYNGINGSNLLVSDGLIWGVCSATMLILVCAMSISIAQRLLLFKEKRTEEVRVTSEEKFRVLVEAVKDYAIFMLNINGEITTWNSGSERILGYSAKEIIGQPVSTFYLPDDVAANKMKQELAFASKHNHFESEVVRIRKNGCAFWAHIVIDPLYNNEGNITGYSEVLRDITDMKLEEERSKNLNEDLERRVRERTLALQERELKLRSITNAIPILVAQFDKNEKFLFANDSFCKWFNVKAESMSELEFKDLLGEELYKSKKIYIDRVLNGQTVSFQQESARNDQKSILEITYVPELEENKKIKGFIVVASDVSKFIGIENELISAKLAAEVANETKSAFLANMSHEIRTPLGAIIGFSELMLNGEMTHSEKMNHVEVIKRNGKLLSAIINDILDLSKVESGKIEFEKMDVSLKDLLTEMIVLLNLEATGKGIRLEVVSEGPIPNVIKTDPTRLRQILFNIVGNAIKFTDKGSVEVLVKLYKKDDKKLAFYIKDTGTGISRENIVRLFSPFSQADVTTTRKFGGTGLGLVLAKKLASALGGDVVLFESTIGVGSTFIITVDHGQDLSKISTSIEKSWPAVAEIEPDSKSLFKKSELSKLDVLVVDDSHDNLLFIQKVLSLSGAKVETAPNGKLGIEKAMSKHFDVILMDLQMPEMDGYEAAKELRRLNYDRPIIALTAHAMKEERKRTLASGFDDHITKPVDRKFLIQTLSTYQS
jgi:PAS domain S-box-containing protein